MSNCNKDNWTNPGTYTPCSIGGQALIEGVMMRGKTSTAVACRDEKGRIVISAEHTKPRTDWYYKVPVIRGAVSFFYSMFDGIKYISKSADVYAGEEDDVKLGFGGMLIAVVMAFALSIGLFVALPKLLHWVIWDVLVGLNSLVSNSLYILIISLTDGVFKVIILILYMYLTSRIKDIKRTYMYHGSEHKTINAYEHSLELTAENVQSCSTRHARCGTTFLFYTIMVSIIVITIVLWLVSTLTGLSATMLSETIGNDKLGTLLYNLINTGISIVCIPFMAGLSYEVLKLVAKAPDNKFTMLLKAPGFMLQGLTTKQPDDDMVEVAIASFKKVLEMDADPNLPALDFYEMTYKDARTYIETEYDKAGITDESEVDWMLVNILKCQRTELRKTVKLTKAQSLKLYDCVSARVKGMPLDYVTGESFFRKNKLTVNEYVHLPRMETETVAGRAIDLIKKNGYKKALDLMTGSGCIALALATETDAKVDASDISMDALKVASKNTGDKVTLLLSDCFKDIKGSYDIIISNPPYIRSAEIETLQPEVKCQPRISLDGGADGLDYYRIIARDGLKHINNDGALVLEIGHDQGKEVTDILTGAGYRNVTVEKDLSGSDRIVTAYK